MKATSAIRVAILGACVLLAGVAGAADHARAAGDAQAGKTKAFSCLGCHGVTGYFNVYPTYRVPRVGGQHADYLVAALEAYKSGQRKHPTMQAQAAALTAQDMADIAAYFETAGGDE